MKTLMRLVRDCLAAEFASLFAAGVTLFICATAGVPAPVALGIAAAVKCVAWVATFILD
jgi:hypothetical protein